MELRNNSDYCGIHFFDALISHGHDKNNFYCVRMVYMNYIL